ncbi:uncharacterized protein LOC124258306 isoform X2 [Haliotis rubra]|uniref:uncharacterized protein LOC124258306 isoform X2 n=1 Tax=Haliotis rubra TaxID=36100 RepID=UPI001EE53E8D|nr:uncharacterized protein LOC124258306 isoform X2 [Haliotis rubra]
MSLCLRFSRSMDISSNNQEHPPLLKSRGSYIRYIIQTTLTSSQSPVPDSQQRHVLERVFNYSLQLLEKRLRVSCNRANVHSLNGDQLSILEKELLRSEDRLMELFMSEASCEDEPDYENPTDDDSEAGAKADHHIFPHVLSHHHEELMSCLNTRGTHLLDIMAQNDLLSESDEEEIRKHESHGERNQRVLEVLSTVSPKKNMQFVNDFIKDTNPDLGRRLSRSMRELAHQDHEHQCAACTVVTQIDPSRIAKVMFINKTIPYSFYNDLRNPAVSSQTKWKWIREKELDIAAINALQPKFQHFHDMFGDHKRLICKCDSFTADPPEGVMTRSSGASTFRNWLSKSKEGERSEITQMKHDIYTISRSVEDIRNQVFLSEPDGHEYTGVPRFASSIDVHHDTDMYGKRDRRVWRPAFPQKHGEDKPKKKRQNIFKRLQNRLRK